MKYTEDDLKKELETQEYEYGFYTELESDTFPKGLNEAIVRAISKKKNEPEWMTEWRLDAFRIWEQMEEPEWANVQYEKPDFQAISYYSAPKKADPNKSLDDVDPELLEMYKKLGISVDEQKKLQGVAVDIVVDSVSVATTFKKTLAEKGIIFMPISEAIQEHPELVKKYMGTVVPKTDNFYAALNSAVFTDGSFCYIPKGVKCPMELSTYFRINEGGTGQFERTLLIADESSYVSYLEGCTAPARDENQLHAAVVELIAMDDAEIKYSTVQNWFPGDKEWSTGGVYNFVTKRGICETNAKISWTQVETGSAVTWKYPSCILKGRQFSRRVLLHCSNQQLPASRYGNQNDTPWERTPRVRLFPKESLQGNPKTVTEDWCKSIPEPKMHGTFHNAIRLLMGDQCGAHTFPYIEAKNTTAQIEHEATTSKIGEDQLVLLQPTRNRHRKSHCLDRQWV